MLVSAGIAGLCFSLIAFLLVLTTTRFRPTWAGSPPSEPDSLRTAARVHQVAAPAVKPASRLRTSEPPIWEALVLVGERIRSAGTRGDSSLPQNWALHLPARPLRLLRQEPPILFLAMMPWMMESGPKRQHTIAGPKWILECQGERQETYRTANRVHLNGVPALSGLQPRSIRALPALCRRGAYISVNKSNRDAYPRKNNCTSTSAPCQTDIVAASPPVKREKQKREHELSG